jgi:hypothetical protein
MTRMQQIGVWMLLAVALATALYRSCSSSP